MDAPAHTPLDAPLVDPLALGVTLAVAVCLSAVHLLAPRLHGLFASGRPGVASFAGGMAVAYAAMVLLPELGYVQGHVGNVVYPLVLAGLVGFYLVELTILRAATRPHPVGEGVRASVHMAISWLYTFGLVYALPDEVHQHGPAVLIICAAIGLHLAYKDYLISRHHPAFYRRRGRFILATGPLAGAALALVASPSELLADMIVALIAGYMLQNVFRNELPDGRRSSPPAFALGAAALALPVALAMHLR